MSAQSVIQGLLEGAGITINGSDPSDIQVHDSCLYDRLLRGGSLALGESYMDGWWDVERLDEFFCAILKARLDRRFRLTPATIVAILRAHLSNDQTRRKAFEVGERHYDLGNDLYAAMLGPTWAYTCGYWARAIGLDEAQVHKLDLVCRKIGLRPGMTVLDIGCGWGSFARYAAVKYGALVTGVSVSREQIKYARTWCAEMDISFRLCDYRQVTGQFDRIVSLGMFEHVGPKNYATFMNVVRRNLKPDGLFLLHTIGGDTDGGQDPWVERYIFPNGVIPSYRQIVQASDRDWVLEDFHNFGADYDPTLMAWRANFVKRWPDLSATYDPRFYRMWTYWLDSSAGAFRARRLQLWQMVFSRDGVPGGYRSIR